MLHELRASQAEPRSETYATGERIKLPTTRVSTALLAVFHLSEEMQQEEMQNESEGSRMW